MIIPGAVAHRPYWQYGRDNHATDIRAFRGSVVLHVVRNDETTVVITFLVMEAFFHRSVEQSVPSHLEVRKIGERQSFVIQGDR